MAIWWIANYLAVFFISAYFNKVSHVHALYSSLQSQTCTLGQKEREYNGAKICCNTAMCMVTFQPCHEDGGNDVCVGCEDGYCSRNEVPYNTTHFKFSPYFACEEIKEYCDEIYGGTEPVFSKVTGCMEGCKCKDGFYRLDNEAKDCLEAVDKCHREGQELSDQGVCVDCPKDKFKNFRVGKCIQKTVCGSNQVTIDQGTTKTDAICKNMTGQNSTADNTISGPGIINDTGVNINDNCTENVTLKDHNKTRTNDINGSSETKEKSNKDWIVPVAFVGVLLLVIAGVTFRCCKDETQKQRIYRVFVEVICPGCLKKKDEGRDVPTAGDPLLDSPKANSMSNSDRNDVQQIDSYRPNGISSDFGDNHENRSLRSNGHCDLIPLTSMEPSNGVSLTTCDSTNPTLSEKQILTSDRQQRSPSISSSTTQNNPSNKPNPNTSVTNTIHITFNIIDKEKDVNIGIETADSPVDKQKEVFDGGKDISDFGQQSQTHSPSSLTDAGCTATPNQGQNIGIALPIKQTRSPSPQGNSSHVLVQQPVQGTVNAALVLNGGQSLHPENTNSLEHPPHQNGEVNSLRLLSAPHLTRISRIGPGGIVNPASNLSTENESRILNLHQVPQLFQSSDTSIFTDHLFNESQHENGQIDTDQTAVKIVA